MIFIDPLTEQATLSNSAHAGRTLPPQLPRLPRMSDDLRDPFWRPLYDVGYKKPPESRRFAKGKSGNPRGRPAKKTPGPKPLVDKSTMESILKMSLREVTARDGDDVTKITAFDAVLQIMLATAMKGSVPAQKAVVALVDRAKKEEAAEIKEDHTFWRHYVVTYNEYTAALQTAGQPVPEGLPHPDDLVFEEGRLVMIRGGDPLIAAKNRYALIRFRDVLMLQAEQDVRRFPCEEKYHHRATIFVSHYLLLYANSCLPKRTQLSDSQIQLRMWNISSFGNRKFEGQLKAGWMDLGVPYARNRVTQPIKPLLRYLGIALPSAITHLRGRDRK
jgi:hypothetical protein